MNLLYQNRPFAGDPLYHCLVDLAADTQLFAGQGSVAISLVQHGSTVDVRIETTHVNKKNLAARQTGQGSFLSEHFNLNAFNATSSIDR